MSDPLIRRRELATAVEKKLPREERRRLDAALRAGDGTSYRELYDQFRISARGVSFSAFYRYAARRRAVARIADMAGEDGAVDACADAASSTATEVRGAHEGLDVEAVISRRTEFDDVRLEHVAARYVCKYMIGLIHSGKAGARDIERLANAYSRTASVQINRDRINANIEYQRERIAVAHKSLQLRAEAAASRAKNTKPAGAKPGPHPEGPSVDAPWGRKADGTPTTREEFLTRLDQAVADIYGLDLKYGPKPIIKRFPGDHLPPEQRTPENIAAGRRGLLPHELEAERKAKEDRVRRAEFDAKRDAEEAVSKAEEAARFAEEAQRRREEFDRQVARGAAAARADREAALKRARELDPSFDHAVSDDDNSPASPVAEDSSASPGAENSSASAVAPNSPASDGINEPAPSPNPAKHHPDADAPCRSDGTSPTVGRAHPTVTADPSAPEAPKPSGTETPKQSGTEAQRQAKLRADRRAQWEEEHKKNFPAPKECNRHDTLDDLLKSRNRTADLPNYCVDWKHK